MTNCNEFNTNGYNEGADLYKSRYYAKKADDGNKHIVVNVCGGYKLLTSDEYTVWSKQK